MTSRKSNFYKRQEGGSRKPPYAFTEQGIYMLATVLKGKLAEQQSIYIMRAFKEIFKKIILKLRDKDARNICAKCINKNYSHK